MASVQCQSSCVFSTIQFVSDWNADLRLHRICAISEFPQRIGTHRKKKQKHLLTFKLVWCVPINKQTYIINIINWINILNKWIVMFQVPKVSFNYVIVVCRLMFNCHESPLKKICHIAQAYVLITQPIAQAYILISRNPSHKRASSSRNPSHKRTSSSRNPSHKRTSSSRNPSHKRTSSSRNPSHQRTSSSRNPSHKCTSSSRNPSHKRTSPCTPPTVHNV